MTNVEQRWAIKTTEYDLTYAVPTSFCVLAIRRNCHLDDHVLAHPYIDCILMEEELHVGSCLNSGDFLTDVLTYIT